MKTWIGFEILKHFKAAAVCRSDTTVQIKQIHILSYLIVPKNGHVAILFEQIKIGKLD